MNEHNKYMQLCIELGEEALINGDPPVGSILVFNNKVIGRGIEAGKSTGDITKHAEVLAINDAIIKNRKSDLSESILYSTHEPCIMCSYAIRHYRIKKIVFGCTVHDVGGYSSNLKVLTDQSIQKWGAPPIIEGSVYKNECEELNIKFKNHKL